MEELLITNEMRNKINGYLGYELIKKGEVGHHIYDEAPGLGKIGIEGTELERVVTNKQLDSNGNVEWYKNPNPKMKPGVVKAFHCKLTTISSKKAKVLIASLFPEEAADKKFLEDNQDIIKELRKNLQIASKRKMPIQVQSTREDLMARKLLMGPNDIFLEGALLYYSGEKENNERSPMLFGPNDMLL